MRQERLLLKPLAKQTIVITGASSGIGLATALMAAKKGANVVLASRNLDDLKRIVTDIQKNGGKAIAVEVDVKKEQDLERLRDRALEAFGSIDTWVNNAGTSIYGRLLDLELEDERELFDANFWGVRHGCRAAILALRGRGGVIINLGSEVSARSVPLQGIYSATKHAVKAYTDALRMELEKDEIPVAISLIRPTAIDTPFPLHAMNKLTDGEPSLPSPTYHPNIVAKAILACAVSPRRDVFVGGQSRISSIMDVLFPRLADYFLETRGFRGQSEGTKVPHWKSQEGLYRAPAKEGSIRGGKKGIVHPTSAYTSASLRPLAAALTLGASVIAIQGVRHFLAQRREKAA